MAQDGAKMAQDGAQDGTRESQDGTNAKVFASASARISEGQGQCQCSRQQQRAGGNPIGKTSWRDGTCRRLRRSVAVQSCASVPVPVRKSLHSNPSPLRGRWRSMGRIRPTKMGQERRRKKEERSKKNEERKKKEEQKRSIYTNSRSSSLCWPDISIVV